MALPDYAVVILAAGKGTRLKSPLAKVLHRAGGRTLIEHVVRACQPLKPRAIIAVVGHQAAEVSAILEPLGVQTIAQEPQRGTGHAMQVARRALGSRVKYAIVLPGDAPLVRSETLAELARLHHVRQSVDPDIDHGRAGLNEVAANESWPANCRDQNVSLARDRRQVSGL